MRRKCVSATLIALSSLFALSVSSWAAPVAFNSPEGATFMAQRDAAATAEGSVLALLQGPTKDETAAGIWSAIPKETKVLSVDVFDGGVLINLSAEAAEGLDDATWETMQQQFIWTMKPLGLEERVKVLIDGKEPTDYMPQPGPALYSAPSDDQVNLSAIEMGEVGLSGKRVTVSAGHGHFWNGSGWYYERPTNCGYEQEDLRNVRFAKYLKAHLENDSAYVQIVREDNYNRGTGPSNVPWFHEGSYIWTRDQGYSCSVWANATGRCGDIVGPTRLSDSIRARPLASNLDDRGNTDVFIDIHSNAYQGDCYGTSCPSGPDGYYCNDSGHQTWGAQSISLAQKVQDYMLAAVQSAGYSMGHHGGSAALYGNFASTRMPTRPATLIELGFHDSCTTDAPMLNSAFFQDCAGYGMYKGVCEYFGNTPTFGLYDSEYISDTIPTQMTAGQQQTVQITFKNKSVQWSESALFRLGAVGDSDPFAGARHTISGIVYQNGTYSWNITFTAPTTPGTYTTDWRMVRDMFAWFGPTLTKQVTVVGSATNTPTRTPTRTPTSTPTRTPTNTPTRTPTNTPTRTPTNTPTRTPTPAGPSEIILDDGDSGYTKSGSWTTTTGGGTEPINGDYDWLSTVTGSETGWAKWQPATMVGGYYDIYVRYKQGTNRAIDAPYTVTHDNGSTTVDVNQTVNGGTWVYIGSYSMSTGRSVKLSNGPAQASKVVIADAIKFTPSAAVTVTIDDGEAGYSKSGSWTTSTGAGTEPINGDYDWLSTVTGSETGWAKWTPTLLKSGSYKVYVRYKQGTNRANDAPYTVYYNGGSQTVDVNQQINGGTWVLLGTYNFNYGTSGYVKLANGPAQASKVVIADAVQFVPQ